MAANAEMAAAAIHAAAEEKMGTVPQIAIYINKREKRKIWKRIPGCRSRINTVSNSDVRLLTDAKSEDSEHQISDSNSWLALINPNG